MDRKLCFIHANCQGDELERLLTASKAFDGTYHIIRRTNYTREKFSDEELARCDLFLYQHLDANWGEFASQALLARVSPTAQSICIPNQYTRAYWPFHTSHSPIVDFGDSLLDRLIDEGASKKAILTIYLHGNIRTFVDLAASFEETVEQEREKERHSPIKPLSYFLEHWKKRQLFHTINHPGRDLLYTVANSLLTALDMPMLSQEELATVESGENFPSYKAFMDLPIHPQVAAFHGLDFGGPQAQFFVFGRQMTFEQYVSRYIDCRQNHLEELFLGYMQAV